jgi:hypothetical protein
MSQEGGRKRYAKEIIERDSGTKRQRKDESGVGGSQESQDQQNQDGNASLPSSQTRPKTRSQTASQEVAMHLEGKTQETKATETEHERIVLVPTPTRITRVTAIACDRCYNGHRKVSACARLTNQASARLPTVSVLQQNQHVLIVLIKA